MRRRTKTKLRGIAIQRARHASTAFFESTEDSRLGCAPPCGNTASALDPDQSPPAAMVTTLALMSRNDFHIGISIAWLCIVVAGMLALLVLWWQSAPGPHARARSTTRLSRVRGPHTLVSHLHIYRGTTGLFVCRHAQIGATLPRVAIGELTMSDTEKTKTEKPETRPIDDGSLTPTPPKTKIVEPVVSRASHFS